MGNFRISCKRKKPNKKAMREHFRKNIEKGKINKQLQRLKQQQIESSASEQEPPAIKIEPLTDAEPLPNGPLTDVEPLPSEPLTDAEPLPNMSEVFEYVIGKRNANVNYLIKSLQKLNDHGGFTCNFSDMMICGEATEGWNFGVQLSCRVCLTSAVVWLEDPDDELMRMRRDVLQTTTVSQDSPETLMSQFRWREPNPHHRKKNTPLPDKPVPLARSSMKPRSSEVNPYKKTYRRKTRTSPTPPPPPDSPVVKNYHAPVPLARSYLTPQSNKVLKVTTTNQSHLTNEVLKVTTKNQSHMTNKIPKVTTTNQSPLTNEGPKVTPKNQSHLTNFPLVNHPPQATPFIRQEVIHDSSMSHDTVCGPPYSANNPASVQLLFFVDEPGSSRMTTPPSSSVESVTVTPDIVVGSRNYSETSFDSSNTSENITIIPDIYPAEVLPVDLNLVKPASSHINTSPPEAVSSVESIAVIPDIVGGNRNYSSTSLGTSTTSESMTIIPDIYPDEVLPVDLNLVKKEIEDESGHQSTDVNDNPGVCLVPMSDTSLDRTQT